MNDILNKIQTIQQKMRTTQDAHNKLLASVRELREQYEALCAEKLTPEVFTRVADWLKDPQRKPAATAFTAGMERQIAYALELDVLPHVKSMEVREQGRWIPVEERAKKTHTDLLVSVANELVEGISGDTEAKMLRHLAYQHWDSKLEREVQVHIVVVADPFEFLEPFQTERTV